MPLPLCMDTLGLLQQKSRCRGHTVWMDLNVFHPCNKMTVCERSLAHDIIAQKYLTLSDSEIVLIRFESHFFRNWCHWFWFDKIWVTFWWREEEFVPNYSKCKQYIVLWFQIDLIILKLIRSKINFKWRNKVEWNVRNQIRSKQVQSGLENYMYILWSFHAALTSLCFSLSFVPS